MGNRIAGIVANYQVDAGARQADRIKPAGSDTGERIFMVLGRQNGLRKIFGLPEELYQISLANGYQLPQQRQVHGGRGVHNQLESGVKSSRARAMLKIVGTVLMKVTLRSRTALMVVS